MEGIFKAIVAFFNSKSLHLGYKLSITILVVLIVFIVNDLAGISRHYLLNAKLQQIIALKRIDSNILKDDSLVNERYLELKAEIVEDDSYCSELIASIKDWFSVAPIQGATVVKPNNNNRSIENRPTFWLNFTAMVDFYIVIFITIVVGVSYFFDKKNNTKDIISGSVGALVLCVALYFIGLFYKFLVLLIPIIDGYVWINCIINFIIPFAISTMAMIYRKNKKTSY